MQHSGHIQNPSDDEDRQNRFLSPNGSDAPAGAMRERAVSQPPRISDPNLLSYPGQQLSYKFPPQRSGGVAAGPNWGSSSRTVLDAAGFSNFPQSIARSSSFSNQPSSFSQAMRDRAFSLTLEDDEYDALNDLVSPMGRGRTYSSDMARSRSQSLAPRPAPVASPGLPTPSAGYLWGQEPSGSDPLNIPGRYGEIKPPGPSRYGSLGALGRSPTNIPQHSPSGLNGYSRPGNISNMSPFVRDVGQILLDDGSAFRELWAGMNPPRDENGAGGSGTTSRRHSVSVVQPRRGTVVGFNAPESDIHDESNMPHTAVPPINTANFGGRGALLLSDEDLAGDFGRLNMNEQPPPSQHPVSQPSSLPVYGPLSRSPPSKDMMSNYQNLGLPGSSFSTHHNLHSPSGESGGSPPRNQPFNQQQARQAGQPELTARYIPGQGIQYLPHISTTNLNTESNGLSGSYSRARAPSYPGSVSSPLSPNTSRAQQNYFSPTQQGRRPSDTPQPINELGKGVPLHAVPASCPLFVVEFKAGRTDVFYLTDLSLDIRINDLVIVEADRGKDLGKVINDSITVEEIEDIGRQQQERAAGGSGFGGPTSPGGITPSTPTAKKEWNPKKIYGKATQQEINLLANKVQEEVKALQLCQTKVRAKKLPMVVVDAEYQWDRRKLTFYFVADKRIDFRELVRELFRLYKTRIWMASLPGTGGFEQ